MRVTATFKAPDNDPVETPWVKDGTEVDVMLAVAQLLNHAKDMVEGPFPVEVLAIHIDL